MSTPARHGQPHEADEAAIRAVSGELSILALEHGISDLRLAGPGRLLGHVAEDRDSFDVADFENAATQLLAADVTLFSDRVLDRANVSPDLRAATPL